MNGSNSYYKPLRVVIDTNVIFMALYDSASKAGRIIKAAIQNKIQLFSTDSVKEELVRVLKKELEFSDEELGKVIEGLPIIWIEKEIYEKALEKTKVKHKADKPLEALSLILNVGVLSANKHFKNRLKIDELLKEIEKI